MRDADMAFIPPDPKNTDWQAYEQWLAEGNVPTPIPQPDNQDQGDRQ